MAWTGTESCSSVAPSEFARSFKETSTSWRTWSYAKKYTLSINVIAHVNLVSWMKWKIKTGQLILSKMSACKFFYKARLDSYPVLQRSVEQFVGSWNFYSSAPSILHVATAVVINWITNATAVLVWILWINTGQFYQSSAEVLGIGIKHCRLKSKNLHARNWSCLKEIQVC